MRRWGLGLLLSVCLVGCASGGRPAAGGQPAPAPGSSAPAGQSTTSGALAGAPPGAPEIVVPPTRIRTSYSVIGSGVIPYWIAAEAGLWQRHGLDVDFTFISGTPPGMAALVAGETQFAVASGEAVLRIQSQNPDVVSLISTTAGNTHRLMVVPQIQRLEDLRGRRIGVAAIGDGAYAVTSKALLKLGFNPSTDVAWIATGGGSTSAMIAGLAAGAFDGAPLTPPNDILASRHGAHALIDTADLDLPAAGMGAHTLRRTLEQQRPVVDAFIAGVIDGVRLLKEDPAFSKGVIARRFDMTDTEAIDWAYEVYSGHRRAPKLYLDHAEMRALVDELAVEYPELQQIQLERVLDNSVLQGLEARGYFTRP